MISTLPAMGSSHSYDNLNEQINTGWTSRSISKLLSISNDNDKLKYVKKIFGVSDDDYDFKETAAFLVDFHLGNAAFCIDSNFSIAQTYFLCQTFSILLDDAISEASEEVINFDELRKKLAQKLHILYRQSAPPFDLHQIESILSFAMSTFLKPLRLIIRQFQQPPYTLQVLEIRKIFHPAPPAPLSEHEEDITISEVSFPLFNLPKEINNENKNQILEDYRKLEKEMEEIANKRLKELNDRIAELKAQLDSD